ncbi:Putative short-chain dehydrogenase/reductase SDR, NAD(P)-binding domain superfamily [Colletotrichum destructivum]|uniref:Short-chain dehydrogenase/reductase SDR, NAD(P)-binding domain superfamily n=1 Tax=Colletotrichum destructivum TaxID=34406 RepID=A0AAX4IKA3_9PEZI|nr:Putative short-chain dehydrogenase/reductase SDR, NAD(P)-binding domain superfamily [Colletotrichum destructivum]
MARNLTVLPAYLTRLFSLAGKTAVVTGGSSGIGREIALALGQSGAKVILVARRAQPLAAAAEQLAQLGVPATPIAADLSNLADLHHASARIKSAHGVPDILVNAAGAGLSRRPPPLLSRVTQGDWDHAIAANLTAPFALGQAFGPGMAARGSGRIINVVGQQSFRGCPGGDSGAYGAAKGGLVSLTRSQAEAWSRSGVLCNAIAPGVVVVEETPASVMEEEEEVSADAAERAEAHAARTMIGRNGMVEDFAGVAVWLASGASAAVTGQTIFVDGGYSATQ